MESNMSYRTMRRILCLIILPGMILSAWADNPQPVDDLKALRQKLRSIREPQQLRQELLKQGLAQETADQPMGFLNDNGDVVLLNPDGFGVDLFHKNLFGDAAKEAIVQVRFQNAVYFVSFFYSYKGAWHRVPGLIAVNREEIHNTPCDEVKRPGKGHFYFDLVEGRVQGEYLLTGKTYGGWCPPSGAERGSEIRQYVWQITRDGIHPLFDEIIHKFWYQSPEPDPVQEPVRQTCTWIAATPAQAFPKAFKCEVAQHTEHTEALPDGSKQSSWKPSGTTSKTHVLPYKP